MDAEKYINRPGVGDRYDGGLVLKITDAGALVMDPLTGEKRVVPIEMLEAKLTPEQKKRAEANARRRGTKAGAFDYINAARPAGKRLKAKDRKLREGAERSYAPRSVSALATSEVDQEFLVEGQLGRLVEGLDDRGKRKQEVWVDLIREGFGNRRDKHYYPREALEAAKQLFEGAKMYVNHLDPEAQKRLNGMPRDVQDLAGRIREVRMGTNAEGVPALQGRVSVSAPWLWQLVEHDPDLIGVSINARGSSRPGRVDGQEAKIVEGINKVGSVDWVTEAGAGGKVVSLVEAQLREEGREDEIMGIETLTEADEGMLEAKAGDVVTHRGKRKRVKHVKDGHVHFEDGSSAPEDDVKDGMKEARTRAHAARHSNFVDADEIDPGLVDPHVAMRDGDAQGRRGRMAARGSTRMDRQDRRGAPVDDWEPYGFDGDEGKTGYGVRRMPGYSPEDLGRGRASAMRSTHNEADAYFDGEDPDGFDEFGDLNDIDDEFFDDEIEGEFEESDEDLDDFEEAGKSHRELAHHHRRLAKRAERMGLKRRAKHHHEKAKRHEMHHRRAGKMGEGEGQFDDLDEDFDGADDFEEATHRELHHKHRKAAHEARRRGHHKKAEHHMARARHHHKMMREGDFAEDEFEGEFDSFGEADFDEDFLEGEDDLELEGDDDDFEEAGKSHLERARHHHRLAKRAERMGLKRRAKHHHDKAERHIMAHRQAGGAYGLTPETRRRLNARRDRLGLKRLGEGDFGDLDDDLEADFSEAGGEDVEARAREIAREHLQEAVGRAIETIQAEHRREVAALEAAHARSLAKVDQRQLATGIIENCALPDASKAALKSEMYDLVCEGEYDEDGIELKSAEEVLTEAVQARIGARTQELSVFTEAGRVSDFGPTVGSQTGQTPRSAPVKAAPTATKMKRMLHAGE